MESRSWRGAVCFDIDGTLVPGTTSGAFLAERLGHGDVVRHAEARYEEGLIGNLEVCRIDALGWAGHTETEVAEWLSDMPLIDGIAETVAWCRAFRLLPFLASLAWDPVGTHLEKRFGFAAHCGPRLVVSAGQYTGEVAEATDEFDKRDFALAACADHQISPSRCAAIGDSRSDLPLFAAAGISIAFNGTPTARAAATHTAYGPALAAVIPLLSDWSLGLP